MIYKAIILLVLKNLRLNKGARTHISQKQTSQNYSLSKVALDTFAKKSNWQSAQQVVKLDIAKFHRFNRAPGWKLVPTIYFFPPFGMCNFSGAFAEINWRDKTTRGRDQSVQVLFWKKCQKVIFPSQQRADIHGTGIFRYLQFTIQINWLNVW